MRAIARSVAAAETWPRRVEERAFCGVGLAMDQRERQIAAEDDAAFAREPIGEAARERADAGDRHHAERDAGDEDAKAVQAAAQFAEREAQRAKSAATRGRGQRHAGFGA